MTAKAARLYLQEGRQREDRRVCFGLSILLQFAHGLLRRIFSDSAKGIQRALAEIELTTAVFPVAYSRRADAK